MTNIPPGPRRSAWHAETGRLMLSGPGWHGIGTLEEWEKRRQEIAAAIHRVRSEADGPALPIVGQQCRCVFRDLNVGRCSE